MRFRLGLLIAFTTGSASWLLAPQASAEPPARYECADTGARVDPPNLTDCPADFVVISPCRAFALTAQTVARIGEWRLKYEETVERHAVEVARMEAQHKTLSDLLKIETARAEAEQRRADEAEKRALDGVGVTQPPIIGSGSDLASETEWLRIAAIAVSGVAAIWSGAECIGAPSEKPLACAVSGLTGGFALGLAF